jgi:hypothetical protein
VLPISASDDRLPAAATAAGVTQSGKSLKWQYSKGTDHHEAPGQRPSRPTTSVSEQEAEHGLALAKQFVEEIQRLITWQASFKLQQAAREADGSSAQ